MALVPRDWSRILVRNRDEKIKDMSRSVLPSSWRVGARVTRRTIHKRERALTRNALAAGRETTSEINDTYRAEIAAMVFTRRFYDKVGPLVRWARATVAADPALAQAPREEQVAYFARLMPPTLIGRHAVSHIAAGLDRADRAVCHSCQVTKPVAETERLVRRILGAGLHGVLNAKLRAAHGRQAGPDGESSGDVTGRQQRPMPRRLLLGAHDAAAFAREMASYPQARAVIATVAAMTEP
jgi:hypothetical protein